MIDQIFIKKEISKEFARLAYSCRTVFAIMGFTYPFIYGTDMKIKSIQTSTEKYLKTSCHCFAEGGKCRVLRVKLTCKSGVFAYGEAPATKVITGEDLESIMTSIAAVKNDLLGLELSEALRVLHKHYGFKCKGRS